MQIFCKNGFHLMAIVEHLAHCWAQAYLILIIKGQHAMLKAAFNYFLCSALLEIYESLKEHFLWI